MLLPKVIYFINFKSTDGIKHYILAPTSLFNVNTGQLGAGAVGLRGRLFRLIRKEVQLIRIDPITEEPVRDKNGFCVKV